MKYRNLTKNEIAVLEKQGCIADDWSNITVKSGFEPDTIRNVSLQATLK